MVTANTGGGAAALFSDGDWRLRVRAMSCHKSLPGVVGETELLPPLDALGDSDDGCGGHARRRQQAFIHRASAEPMSG